MRYLSAVIFLVYLIPARSQSGRMSTEQYILTYKDYAIIEMYRAGIPASITLAQGILESESGNSRLAKEGNNHFGIKCKTGWTGKTIIADDDTTGECFRAYGSALESYRDHSDFLKNNWRYSECFGLACTDYKGWSEGLKKAGYATNPKYTALLNGIIAKYKLSEYDLAPRPEGIPESPEEKRNTIPSVYAQQGETIETIAQKTDIDARQIYRYNDLKTGTQIDPGDIVYLKPKKRKGPVPFVVLKENESLYDLSQTYGIKLKHLYKLNHIKDASELTAGSKVYLQKPAPPKPETTRKATASDSASNTNRSADPVNVAKNTPVKITASANGIHVVATGDNLYRIADAYNVEVEQILEWNNISSPDQIKPGDKLIASAEAAIKNNKSKKTPDSPVKSDPKGKIHVVSKGDTVYRICKTYGISSDQLSTWNTGMDLGSIREGQKLVVSQ